MQILLMIAGGAALAYWIRHAGGVPSLAGSWLKTGSVVALALAGAMAGAPWLIVAGLALGSLGDFALSRVGQGWFLAGMGAFGLGHLAYALAFAGAEPASWRLEGPLWQLAALGLLLVSTEAWLAPRTGALRWPVRGYVLVIGAMGLAALMLPPLPGAGWLRFGAALFILSDLLLALQLFVLAGTAWTRGLARIVWPVYWGAQALILLGGAAASGAF